MSHIHFAAPALLDLQRFGTLKEQLNCLAEIPSRFFDGVPLTGDIQLGTQGHETRPFPFNDRREIHQYSLQAQLEDTADT